MATELCFLTQIRIHVDGELIHMHVGDADALCLTKAQFLDIMKQPVPLSGVSGTIQKTRTKKP